ARHRAAAVADASGTRLHPGAAPERGFDAARLRAAMTLDSTTYRHALRITAVSAAVFALVGAVGLPHGEWATLAVLRVLRPQFGATLQRAGQRVAGNLIGGTCAALLIAGVSGPAALAVLLFAVISAGFALRPVNYTFWVIFGTPLVLLLGDVADPGDWQAAFERIGMTVIGSAAALLGGYLLWPTWDHDRLAERTAEAGRAATGYLDTTLDRLVRPHDPARPRPALRADEARRTAEGALAKAWALQRQARTEPGHDPAAVASAATALEGLAELMEHLGALGAHATPAPPYLPGLAEYGAHAPAALTAKSPQERAAHADAVSDAVDGMRLHLAGLHARRLAELEAHGDDDTPTRRALRAGEPVVVLLATIAECVGRLSRRPW
ncbi:FUSC family protein, partial [Streptomyces sp. NPDC056519]|uniref:FUSC family protein n=1 Tax=Streptomyces sp. NPDC056519 TaxID=3345849 RepID=UPI0036AF34F6